MAEIFHICGAPLKLSPTGGIQLSDGPVMGQQQIIRRLLTNTTDLLSDLKFGANIPRSLGSPGIADQITATIKAQMRLEPIVIQNPPPKVGVFSDPDTGYYIATIQYQDNITLETNQIQLPLGS